MYCLTLTFFVIRTAHRYRANRSARLGGDGLELIAASIMGAANCSLDRLVEVQNQHPWAKR